MKNAFRPTGTFRLSNKIYNIRELLGDIKLDDYLDTPVGRLNLLDARSYPIAEVPDITQLCTVAGMSEASVAKLDKDPLVQVQCEPGVLTTVARLMLDGKKVGYLVHKGPLRQFFEHDALPPDAALILSTVARVAKRIETRLIVERRRAIYGDALTEICSAPSPSKILEILFHALEEFIGEVNICFYALDVVKGGVKVSHCGGVKGDHAGATRSGEHSSG